MDDSFVLSLLQKVYFNLRPTSFQEIFVGTLHDGIE